MLNKFDKSEVLKNNKIKGELKLGTRILSGALALVGAVGLSKLGIDAMNKVPYDMNSAKEMVSEQYIKGNINLNTNPQLPLSKGVQMPKEYVPQEAKTNGLDAFDEVKLDKSQDWAAVDRATARKPSKPGTAKRSD